MASFGPLQSAGGVASSNFEFTHLSIHATTGKMKVQHGKVMQPELMEGIMELVAQSCATFEARGTPEYDAYLMRLPAELRNSYHRLNQMGAHSCVTLFFAQRGRESMATMEVADLVKEESDTMEFSYWREVKNLYL